MMKEIGSWRAGCNAQGCPHLVPPGSGVEPVFQSTKSCKSIDLACPHPSREGNGPAIAGQTNINDFSTESGDPRAPGTNRMQPLAEYFSTGCRRQKQLRRKASERADSPAREPDFHADDQRAKNLFLAFGHR